MGNVAGRCRRHHCKYIYINLVTYLAELFIYDRTELFPARIGAVQARNVES